MTTIISTAVTAQQNLGTDDLIVTSTGSIVISSNLQAITLTSENNIDGRITIFGNVVAEGVNTRGIEIAAADGVTVSVGASGSISATGPSGLGVFSRFGADDLTVNNAGFIEATDMGVLTNANNGVINNTASGTIIGGSNDGDLFGGIFSAAIVSTGANSVLNNAGTIIGEENVDTGRSVAVANATGDALAPGGFAQFNDIDYVVNNSGDIFGELFLGGGEDTVNNSGNISDRVDMGRDDDLYDGRGGVVDDRILLGQGNDEAIGGSYRDIIDGGSDNDTIKGRAGDDALEGGGGEDELSGGSGMDALSGDGSADLLRGNGGDDVLQGGTGGDTLRGGSGDDEVSGGSGGDSLHGGSGDDDLRGGSGSDTISGGSGADTLDGGSSSDQLTGGGGRDVFVFTSPGHSPDNSNRDEITDFTVGQDKLDLSAMANFSFIGTSAFSGNGDAEVRATVSSSGNVSVRIDVDGDGSSDSRIVLTDVDGTLSAADFIL